MSKRLNITAVSYLNTIPFVFGLMHTADNNSFNLQLDYPAECARKLLNNEVDIGLVPLYAILNKPEYRLISDYCIGAVNDVRTVALLSNAELSGITRVYLDRHSKTSVNLVKVLAKYYWKCSFEWIDASVAEIANSLQTNEAVLAIGDKVFELEKGVSHKLDLAKEWQQFTGLPMVFAVWVTSKQLPDKLISEFNSALEYGVSNIPNAVSRLNGISIPNKEAINYLTSNISYTLDKPKRDAIALFEHYVNQFETIK